MLAAVTLNVSDVHFAVLESHCQSYSLSVIEEMAKSINTKLIVVGKETYVDFSTEGSAALVQQYPNIVILQTLQPLGWQAHSRCSFCIGSRCDSTHE
jgi:hypothetical protein